MKSPDGLTCIDCAPYTRAQDGNTRCAANQCHGNNLVIIKDGSCVPCSSTRDCIM